MTNPTKIYWDACCWIGLINQEPDKIVQCEHVISLAESGDIEIWTSHFTLAEVYKRKCENADVGLDEAGDRAFEDFISQDRLNVKMVNVDYPVGILARRLLRAHPELRKPQDAIHLASALIWRLDEFHTFDGDNILPLKGLLERPDGVILHICVPPNPPPPAQSEPRVADLFAGLKEAAEAPAVEGAVERGQRPAAGESDDEQ